MKTFRVTTRHDTWTSERATREEAQAVVDRFNADPWLDAETPDPDAPYRVVEFYSTTEEEWDCDQRSGFEVDR